MKRRTIPKIAVLATGLTAAVLVATINPAPAQASPGYASTCTNCHTAGGSVVATPSTATVAPSAAYTVALVFTGGTTPVGYWISGNGASVTASNAGPASMTAPAAAGSYTYTVWMRSGVVASTTYSITVGPVATTPPPTTVPPTTIPPTTVPPTTIPPTTVPPTTVPPTTVPPTTIPPVTYRGDGEISPNSVIGVQHLSMYKTYGSISCAACHNGITKPKPPILSMDSVNMKPGIACATCHGAGKRESDTPLFISLMNTPPKAVYKRCSDCHTFATNGDGGSDD